MGDIKDVQVPDLDSVWREQRSGQAAKLGAKLQGRKYVCPHCGSAMDSLSIGNDIRASFCRSCLSIVFHGDTAMSLFTFVESGEARILKGSIALYALQKRLQEALEQDLERDLVTGFFSAGKFKKDLKEEIKAATDKYYLGVMVFKLDRYAAVMRRMQNRQSIKYELELKAGLLLQELMVRRTDLIYYMKHGVFVALMQGIEPSTLEGLRGKLDRFLDGKRNRVRFPGADGVFLMTYTTHALMYPDRNQGARMFEDKVTQLVDAVVAEAATPTAQ